jgi:formylglycine-generating enzyme required for sulfatase activity
LAWLSNLTGQPYRLLTEAEYEYAARAGMQTAYPWGDEIGNGNADCAGCGSRWDNTQPAPVGSFAPNRFGLYDMAGNVWEWVDCAHSNYNDAPRDGAAWIEGGICASRVARGGSWNFLPLGIRSANRSWHPAGYQVNSLGFRVGRTLSAGTGAITVAPGVRQSGMTFLRIVIPL